jgi:phosphatidylinositol glycan class U
VDLTPNVGLGWYLMTQMFDRFRLFFLCLLAALPVALNTAVACSLPMRRLPLLGLIVGCQLTAALHPQLVLGAVNLQLCLLLLAAVCGLLPFMRRVYALLLMLSVSLLLLELMAFLWLAPGSGNANFVYFQSLLFMFALLSCSVELLAASRKAAMSISST